MNRFYFCRLISIFLGRGMAKRSLAGATAVLFSCSTLAAPLAEANFWSERRQAARQAQAQKINDPSSQYARLPGELSSLGRALPSVEPQKVLFAAPRDVSSSLPESVLQEASK